MAHYEGYETLVDIYNRIKDLCDIISIDSDGLVVFGDNAPTPCRNAVQNVINAWVSKPSNERFPTLQETSAWRSDLRR